MTKKSRSPFDWAEVKRLAFGALELTPDEFWQMPIADFMAMVDGYEWRMERTRELVAWHAAWVMRPHMREAMTPEQLLGRKGKGIPLDEKFKALRERRKAGK